VPIAANIPIIATTTNSSINEKPAINSDAEKPKTDNIAELIGLNFIKSPF
jgi:hypothetical protein